MTAVYDRTIQDTGNIVALEHVNLAVPDQQTATAFYIMGLGFTRDPYMTVGLNNMWINIGRSQCHLPTAEAQRLCGTIGLVVPDQRELVQRLESVASRLANTQFAFRAQSNHIDVTCPWGNRFRCHAPGAEFGAMDLALAYVEFEVAHGSVDGIARFYRDAMGARVIVEQRGAHPLASVSAGTQKLRFVETETAIPPYDGHHIQIYIANFAGPHRFLNSRGLVTEESSAFQYRFCDIVDPDSGRILHKVEHEVRSLSHPLYGRPLVNRNPAQSLRNYVRGQDGFRGAC